MRNHSVGRVKVAAGAALAAVAIAALAGCSSSDENKPVASATSSVATSATSSVAASASASVAESPSSPPAESAPPAEVKKATLKVVVPSLPSADEAFKAFNKTFEAAYPGVTVNFEAVPVTNYNTVKSARLLAGDVDIYSPSMGLEKPDYVPDGNEQDDAIFAKSGGLVDLTDSAAIANQFPGVTEATQFGKRNYAVTMGVSYFTGVYYNKAMFKDKGLKIPTTWSEFVALGETLKAAGITPIGIGGLDGWPAGLPMQASVQGSYPTVEARKEFAKGLWDQSVSLTDEKNVQVLDRMQKLFDFAQPNFTGEAYSAIPAGFVAGKFAMTPDGTWNAPAIAKANPSFEFGYFPLPTSEVAQENANLSGKIETQLAIPSKSENIDLAKQYLDLLMEPKNYAMWVTASGYSSSEPDVATTPFLVSIQPYTKEFSLGWDQLWFGNAKSGPAASIPFNHPALKPFGKLSPKDAAAQAQADWKAGF